MDYPLDLLTTRILGRAKDTETAGQVARKDSNMTALTKRFETYTPLLSPQHLLHVHWCTVAMYGHSTADRLHTVCPLCAVHKEETPNYCLVQRCGFWKWIHIASELLQ